MQKPKKSEEAMIYSILNYQYGFGAGDIIFEGNLEITRYKSGIVRGIYLDKKLIATMNPTVGVITLSKEGARLIYEKIKNNAKTIVVDRDEFIEHSRKSLLAPIVKSASPDIRMGDEVFIVDEKKELLAIGKALLSAIEINMAKKGEVARIRRMLVNGKK